MTATETAPTIGLSKPDITGILLQSRRNRQIADQFHSEMCDEARAEISRLQGIITEYEREILKLEQWLVRSKRKSI